MYRTIGKRLFDCVVAALAMIALSPLLVLVGTGVWLTAGRPILFSQRRPGRGGRPFTLYKFRTMSLPDPTDDDPSDAQRLTRFGRFLRRTSLDELPELWNVLRGDMSLVGPRPLLMEYLPLYADAEGRRHEVRPGLTGWAQVRGRNALPWTERFAHDVWYVDHVSLALDLRILMRTVWHLLAPKGISQPGHATMEPFRGHGH